MKFNAKLVLSALLALAVLGAGQAARAQEICRCCVFKVELHVVSIPPNEINNDAYICDHSAFCRTYDTCDMPNNACDSRVCFGSTDLRCDHYYCLPAAFPGGMCPETNGTQVGTVDCGGQWPSDGPKTQFCRSQGQSNAVACPACACVSPIATEIWKRDLAMTTWEAGGDVSSATSVTFKCVNGSCTAI